MKTTRILLIVWALISVVAGCCCDGRPISDCWPGACSNGACPTAADHAANGFRTYPDALAAERAAALTPPQVTMQ
ncbi:MAG: hypothetical protein AB7O59_15285 [Pirellulales bacterium]